MKVVLALVLLFAVSQASPVPGSAYDLFQKNAQDSVIIDPSKLAEYIELVKQMNADVMAGVQKHQSQDQSTVSPNENFTPEFAPSHQQVIDPSKLSEFMELVSQSNADMMSGVQNHVVDPNN